MIGWRSYARPSRGNPHARDLGSDFVIGKLAIPGEFIFWITIYLGITGVLAAALFGILALTAGFN